MSIDNTTGHTQWEHAQHFLASIVESSKDSIITIDFERTITSWNKAAQQLYGYPSAEVVGKPLTLLTLPEDLQQVLSNIDKIKHSETVEIFDTIRLNKDGREMHLEVVLSPVKDTTGQVIGVSTIARDITERKQGEAKRFEREQEFEALVENAPDIVSRYDRKFRHLYVNRAVAQATGLPASAFIGKTHEEMGMPRHLQAEWQAILEDVFVSGKERETEFEFPTPNGTRFYHSRLVPERAPDGRIGSVLNIARDITERTQSEQTLLRSEERYRSLSRATSQIVWTSNIDGKTGAMLEWNEYTGQSLEESKDWGWAEAIHPDDRDRIGKLWTNCVEAKSLYVTEYRLRGANGLYRFFAVCGVPIIDTDGTIREWVGTCTDIHDLKQAEANLHQAKEELELRVMERTSELENSNRVLRNNEVRLLEANSIFTTLTRLRATTMEELESAFQRVTEASSEVLDAERCSVWLYNEDRSAIECLDLYETATRKHSHGIELTAQDFPAYFQALESGRTIVADDAHTHSATHEFAESYLKPLGVISMLDTAIIVGGEMAGVLCCERTGKPRSWKAEDQTFSSAAAATCALALESYERARAQEEMRHARDEAERANAAKDEFLSRMSHELRTPLNAILGFGQILEMQENQLSALHNQSVQQILKAGRHQLNLVDEVLDIARIQAPDFALSLEPVPLAEVVREALDMLQVLATSAGVTLMGQPAGAPLVFVSADRQRLLQILLNLLSNAVKYNKPGGASHGVG